MARQSFFATDVDKLNWEISEQPVYTGSPLHTVYDGTTQHNIKIVEGVKALVRDDNKDVLSIKKDSYNPLTNARFMEIAEFIKQYSGFELSGYQEYKNGAKVLGYLKNTSDVQKIGGHVIEDYMLIGNSFDGSTSFFSGCVTELLRCTNQFGRINQVSRIRHTLGNEGKINELLEQIEQHFASRSYMYNSFNRMGEKIVSDELFEKALNYILEIDVNTEISTRKANQKDLLTSCISTESRALGKNVWGLFNGVTWYTTHELNSKEKVKGNIFGTPYKINERAFEFCNSLVTA